MWRGRGTQGSASAERLGRSVAARLADAGDLAAVMTENQPLEQIGDRFPDRGEAYLHFTVGRDLCERAHQSQWRGQEVAQVNFEDALTPGLRQRGRCLPHRAVGIEANGDRRRTWAIGHQQLPYQV